MNDLIINQTASINILFGIIFLKTIPKILYRRTNDSGLVAIDIPNVCCLYKENKMNLLENYCYFCACVISYINSHYTLNIYT